MMSAFNFQAVLRNATVVRNQYFLNTQDLESFRGVVSGKEEKYSEVLIRNPAPGIPPLNI